MPRARITIRATHPRQASRNMQFDHKRMAEIRRLQKSEKCVTSKAALTRVTREIMAQFKSGMRLKSNTVDALQIASEDYLHKFFKKAAALAAHAGRATITADDLSLMKTLEDIERKG